MHILLLNDDVFPAAKGGVAVVTDFLRTGLREAGHTVTFITTHQTEEPLKRFSDERGEVISIPVSYPAAQRHRWVVSKTPVSAQLDQLLAALKPDVVHAHNIHAYLTYDALNIARRHADRVFLTIHDTFSVSFARVGGDRYRAAALADKPYRLHWWENMLAAKRGYWPTRNAIIRSTIQKSVTHVIVYTKAMHRFLEVNGIPKLTFICSGIPAKDPPPADAVKKFRADRRLTGPTVFFGARISEDKGMDALLAIIPLVQEQIPGIQFLIAGDEKRVNPYLTRLPDRVRACIRPTGWLPYEDLMLAYAASDVITTPSIYLDNFPTINLEAMMAAKPVVGTCFGGTPEVVEDGITGFIVNPLDTKHFAALVTQLLQDPALREQMGNAGRERVMKEFSMEKQLEKLLKLYRA